MMTPYIRMRMTNKDRGEFRAEGSTLWLYDVIASDDDEAQFFGGVSPRAFISALRATSGPVLLRINSPGGSVFGAQAMIAAMREHEQPITVRVDSLAASAASIIAAEAAAVEMVSGAMLMIHKAWGLTVGNDDDHLATAGLLEKIDGEIAAAYARRAGSGNDLYWRTLMRAETWFTASEAVDAGLADRLIEGNAQRPAAKWDLSAYARVPDQPEAPAAPVHDMRATRQRQLAARLVLTPV